ncbi:hypothetical protein ACJX0J_012899 [Zea mays]
MQTTHVIITKGRIVEESFLYQEEELSRLLNLWDNNNIKNFLMRQNSKPLQYANHEDKSHVFYLGGEARAVPGMGLGICLETFASLVLKKYIFFGRYYIIAHKVVRTSIEGIYRLDFFISLLEYMTMQIYHNFSFHITRKILS